MNHIRNTRPFTRRAAKALRALRLNLLLGHQPHPRWVQAEFEFPARRSFATPVRR